MAATRRRACAACSVLPVNSVESDAVTMRGFGLVDGIAMGWLAAIVAIAWSTAGASLERRRRLRRGEIRPLEGSWRTVAGCRVFARVLTAAASPGGSPVVLVHGLGVSSSYLVPTAERLATEFAVYAPDLPGHGRSETPRAPMDIPRLADALMAWMDAAGLDRASFVANSMGCQIVVDAALRYPDRVDRLVLTGSNSDPSGRTAIRHVGRLLLDVPFERPALIPVVLIDYVRMGPRVFSELRSMLRDRMEDKLPRLDAPTMLVRGEHDSICPPRWFDEAADLVRAERTVVIPRWGHAVNFSAAGPLVDAVAPFLRATRSRPPADAEAEARWTSISGDAPGRFTARHGV